MGNGPADLREKATSLAGILFEMIGVKNGKQRAEQILKSGKAERKLREIIQAQGGDPKVKPEDIEVGRKKAEVTADKDGTVLWIINEDIAKIAKEAGAPKDKGAGLMLHVKLGDHVKKDQVFFEIFAERSTRLQSAFDLADRLQPVGLSKKPEQRMLMEQIPTRIVRPKAFAFER
jgi:AMP phosphorylase